MPETNRAREQRAVRESAEQRLSRPRRIERDFREAAEDAADVEKRLRVRQGAWLEAFNRRHGIR